MFYHTKKREREGVKKMCWVLEGRELMPSGKVRCEGSILGES